MNKRKTGNQNRHIFTKIPIFVVGMQPTLLLVKCPCGRIHKEYFGPKDFDIPKTKIRFLEKQLRLAFGIISRGRK